MADYETETRLACAEDKTQARHGARHACGDVGEANVLFRFLAGLGSHAVPLHRAVDGRTLSTRRGARRDRLPDTWRNRRRGDASEAPRPHVQARGEHDGSAPGPRPAGARRRDVEWQGSSRGREG
jgi:hypothetical protein